MDLRCKADFSDVDTFFSQGFSEVDKIVDEVGQHAVEYAKEHGDYQDRTGLLRKSNKHEVDNGTLILSNDATAENGYQYAAIVESKGYEVLSGAALEAERGLKQKFEQ